LEVWSVGDIGDAILLGTRKTKSDKQTEPLLQPKATPEEAEDARGRQQKKGVLQL